MATPRYPTADGLENALRLLAAGDAGRLNSTIPVLLAVEAAIAAGQAVEIAGVPAIPNPRIFTWLDGWFDLSGNGQDYFVPFSLPGGASRHRRDEKILAQGTMTAAKGRGWVEKAEPVPGSKRDRAYPLVDLQGWRGAVANALEKTGAVGIDLALLGIWLARSTGVPATAATPSRAELVAFALQQLGLPVDGSHDLCHTTPPILATGGEDPWAPAHFADAALSLEEIVEVCDTVDPESSGNAVSGAATITAITLPPSDLELDDHVRRMLRVSIASSNAVMLVGPPGTGKTDLVAEVGRLLADGRGNTLGITTPPAGIVTVTPDDEWSASTLIGAVTLDEHQHLSFRPGYVLTAIARNEWLLLDEANRGDLDKIFGGLLTWLSGKRVQVGMTSTAHNAQPIFLDWSDAETCSVDPPDPFGGAAATKPITFIAGKNWRLLGTFNPVDAQRVFKLGQALGRRFRRVPVPPPSFRTFESLLAKRTDGLDPSLRWAIGQLYRVHDQFEPPLGAAPFLDLCAYLLTAATITEGTPGQDAGEPPDDVPSAPASGDGGAYQELEEADGAVARPRLDQADSMLLAEAYVASLGTWLAQLNPAERSKMRASLVPDVFSSVAWAWLERTFRSL